MRDPLIYPVLPVEPLSAEQLHTFVPLLDERRWAQQHTRSQQRQLELLAILKTFEYLGYFARPTDIAPSIVAAIARRMDLAVPAGSLCISPASLYRGRTLIRQHLGVEPWTAKTRRELVNRLASLNQGRAGPNDLLNAAIEYLRRELIELPALATLRRIIGELRTRSDRAFCAAIVTRLSAVDRQALESLMVVEPGQSVSGFERIKQSAPRPSLKHLASH